DKKVDIELIIVPAPEINGVLQFGAALNGGSIAAGESGHIGIAEPLDGPRSEGYMIGVGGAVLGHGGQDVVVESPLIVIHEFGPLLKEKEISGKFEHIVGRTGFVLSP